jgi:two-component system, sensor histidine kinase and response regulator
LMDVQMPEMDGFETAAAIRATERESHTHQPIIAVTAYAMKGDREKCLKAGMDAYLAKPIDSKDLFRLVETLAAATPDTEMTSLARTSRRSASGWPAPASSRSTHSDFTKTSARRSPVTIDFGPALHRLAGDSELLRRQMSLFLDESPKLVALLQESIESANAQNAKLAAHRLSGLVSSYDHHDATRIARQLERRVAASRWSGTPELAASLARHVDQLAAAIRDFVG